MAVKDIPEIGAEFPAWEGWQSLVGGQLHARLRNTTPPVMVHAETVDVLRRQIVQHVTQHADDPAVRSA